MSVSYPALDRTAAIDFGDDGPLGPFSADLTFSQADGTVTYVVTRGSLLGNSGTVPFTAQEIAEGVWLVAWQEEGNLTVVQVQNFNSGLLRCANVTGDHELVYINGTIHLT
jgi:hypothetical protein